MAETKPPEMVIRITPDGNYTVEDQDGKVYEPEKFGPERNVGTMYTHKPFVFFTALGNPTCYMYVHDGLCNMIKIPYEC